jgi:hypothetical protein
LRKPNYRQQKKTREDARKVRHAKKQERRQTPADQAAEDADAAQSEDSKPSEAQ